MAIMHLQPCGARASAPRRGAFAACCCVCAQPAAAGTRRRDMVVAQWHVVSHLLAGVDEHNLLPAARAVRASASHVSPSCSCNSAGAAPYAATEAPACARLEMTFRLPVDMSAPRPHPPSQSRRLIVAAVSVMLPLTLRARHRRLERAATGC